MKGILTAKAINIEQLKRMTHDKNVIGGEEDYATGRVTVGRVEPQWAQLTVLDAKNGRPYTVGVRSSTEGVSLTCTCRDAYLWVPCRHRYGAALALRDYLIEHPPKIWRMVLDNAAQTAPRRTTTNNSLIVFSLIERNNGGWAVMPYTLNGRHFENIDLADHKAVARAVVERNMSSDAKALRSRVSRNAYPLASDDDITAANLALGNPYAAYGYASSRESSAYYEAVLPYLSRCLAFIGEDGDPLQAELEVKAQQGTVEAELVQTRKGLQMNARIAVGDETIEIKPRTLMALSRDPLWLLADTTLVRVGALDGVATALLDNPNLTIPPEDADEFYDRYLLPLSERVPVRGDMLQWEDVEATVAPRLYLGEDEGALQAELRFGYGPYELLNEKNPPAQTVRRVPGETRFARIKRDLARESAAAAELGAGHGFKKGSEAYIFPLRANVNPIDFLLHQVPKLVAKGFTVFGEEALVSAKVNRNRPTISFNVTSGIDWFDVQANVNFGELEVSLKDIRQAVKKREKYIKLADGSIGALPEEWIEQYRHLFAMGNDAGEDTLRFNQSQLTLIDQLLGEADRAETDEAFRQRREKLRNFENITPQPLPPGFQGELRPYQKFGYDWLHFLQEYNFGGCLADDMGVGKCVLPDTQLFVNGELQTAEQLWKKHAGQAWFDGEGDWSKPTERLLVNALDQTTHQMVEAPITRFYRQHINERVRRVTLEDGSTITTTLRHKLLTSIGWSNQLAVGDYVCLPRQLRHVGMHITVYINGSQQFSRESLISVVHAMDKVTSGEVEQAYRSLVPSKWTKQTLAAYTALDKTTLIQRRQQLQHLRDQEVFYCRVASVEEFEYKGWVYDFEVHTHHNFVANGILCHNTIQTLAFLESVYDRENDAPATLIVMPRSLLFNWQREAEKFTPGLDVYVHADQGRISEPAQFAEHDLVLTTYGTMLRDIELLRKYEFHHVILDESQAIKNPVAETSKAARLLRGKHRLALTGTPIENTTLELWSQFAFLNPGLLGSVDYFRHEFANPIERHQNGDTAQFLRKMVFPFILRRTKDQVATDLPPRSEEIVFCDMEPSQRKFYTKQRDYYRATLLGLIDNGGMDDARMKILEGLLRLRQICNHPKLVDGKFKGDSGKFELLLETLDTLRAEGHRALIFSQFVQMLTIVREALDAKKIPYAYLDGQTRDRQAQVDQFQNDDSLPFFLISLKAGGVGLNLTAADYVIHIDPWWNPAVEQQATDRTHRIGQDKPVFVYKFVARDSVEEKILKLQDQKRELVSQIISSEGGVFKSLTRDDVAVLFS